MPIQTQIIRPTAITSITGWSIGQLASFLGRIGDGDDSTVVLQTSNTCAAAGIEFENLGPLQQNATINSIKLVYRCQKLKGDIKIESVISDDLGSYSSISITVDNLVLGDVELPELTVDSSGAALTTTNIDGLSLEFDVHPLSGPPGEAFRLTLADIFFIVSIETPAGPRTITLNSGTITLDSGKITVE